MAASVSAATSTGEVNPATSIGRVSGRFRSSATMLSRRVTSAHATSASRTFDGEEGRHRDQAAGDAPRDPAVDQPPPERVEDVRDGDREEDHLDDFPQHRRGQQGDGSDQPGEHVPTPSERGHGTRFRGRQ